MIFNTIQKELRNFNSTTSSFGKKCSLQYDKIQKESPKHIKATKLDFNINKKHIEIIPINFNSPKNSQASKNFSPKFTEKSYLTNKSNTKYLKQQKTPYVQSSQILFNNRCHPQKFTKSQRSSSRIKLNNKKQHEVIEEKNNLKLVYSSKQKQKQSLLSQTAVSMGSQLYQLSPIHFQKYMEYKQVQQKSLKNSNKQHKKQIIISNLYRQQTNHAINSQIKVSQQNKDLKYQTDRGQNPKQINIEIKVSSKQDRELKKQTEPMIEKNINNIQKQTKIQNIWMYILLFCVFSIFLYQIIR